MRWAHVWAGEWVRPWAAQSDASSEAAWCIQVINRQSFDHRAEVHHYDHHASYIPVHNCQC